MIRVLVAVVAALIAVVVTGGGPEATTSAPPPDSPTAAQPSPGRVEALMARHDCWTGAAPADVTAPSKAVVTLPGERARVVTADVGYEIWLEGEPGVLHGFCR